MADLCPCAGGEPQCYCPRETRSDRLGNLVGMPLRRSWWARHQRWEIDQTHQSIVRYLILDISFSFLVNL